MINIWLDHFFFPKNRSSGFSRHILEIVLSGFVLIVLYWFLRQDIVSEGMGEAKEDKCMSAAAI